MERIQAKPPDHWMLTGDGVGMRLRMPDLCENCRVEQVVIQSFERHGIETRMVRTAKEFEPTKTRDKLI